MRENKTYFETELEKDEFVGKLDELLRLSQNVIYQNISKKQETRARKRLEKLKKKIQEGKEYEI